MSQWFLEYYRSGNIFIYKFNGRIAEDKFAKMKTARAAANKSPEIPIRYIILDPKQVSLQVGPTYNKTYVRQLSTFEIERLRNPKTPEDVQMLKDYPKDIQLQIKKSAGQPWIYAPLDTSRLYYNFYRKQDYEPLAVPMIFPLLNRTEAGAGGYDTRPDHGAGVHARDRWFGARPQQGQSRHESQSS
jgi:hypothetical protein